MLKPAIEALKNTLLASAQPITAAIHRTWAQQIIDELYNADSRAAVLAGTTTTSPTLNSGDKVFIVRAAAGLLIDSSAFNSLTDSLQRNITKVSHGFVVGNVLTLDGSGVFVKVTDPTTNKFVGVVTAVVSTSVFRVALAGYITGLSGLTPGSVYYATASGTLSTTPSAMPVLIAGSSTTGYIMGGSGGGTDLAIASTSDINTGTDNAKYITSAGLQASKYITQSGSRTYAVSSSAANTYTVALTPTVTVVAAGMFLKLKFNNASTSSTPTLNVDGTGAVTIVRRDGSALLTGDLNGDHLMFHNGTNWVVINPAVSSPIKSISLSNGSSGSNNHDCQNQQQVKILYTNTVTGNITITRSNDSNLEVMGFVIPITGSNINITFPSDVRMARYMEGAGWDATNKILTVSSVGTADLHEFSISKSGSVYLLRYDGPTRA